MFREEVFDRFAFRRFEMNNKTNSDQETRCLNQTALHVHQCDCTWFLVNDLFLLHHCDLLESLGQLLKPFRIVNNFIWTQFNLIFLLTHWCLYTSFQKYIKAEKCKIVHESVGKMETLFIWYKKETLRGERKYEKYHRVMSNLNLL